MSAALVVATLAFLTALLGLLVGFHTRQRLRAMQGDVASAIAAVDQERQAAVESIAAAQRSTVDEVTTLLENLLAQVDTDLTAKVAEALALPKRDAITAEAPTEGVANAP